MESAALSHNCFLSVLAHHSLSLCHIRFYLILVFYLILAHSFYLIVCVRVQLIDILPESAAFCTLREMEREVDSLLASRRAQMVDAMRFPPRMNKTLRLSIHSQYLDQNAAGAGRPPLSLSCTPRGF